MLFARVNRFLRTALEDCIHKTDIHRVAISNVGATKSRALTLEQGQIHQITQENN